LKEPRHTLAMGAILIALATVLGALGAHALSAQLPPERLQVYETAVRYQFLQALGLLVIGVLRRSADSRMLRTAAGLVLAGTLLFSGSLYLLACGGPHALGLITPIGGAALVGGWLAAAAALWRQ